MMSCRGPLRATVKKKSEVKISQKQVEHVMLGNSLKPQEITKKRQLQSTFVDTLINDTVFKVKAEQKNQKEIAVEMLDVAEPVKLSPV